MFKEKIKVLGLCGAVIASAAAGGCSLPGTDYSRIEGYAQAARAQKLYSELESCHFYMQNNATSEKTVEFTFKYRADGQLEYMYTASDEEGLYLEYHNGSELNRREVGQKEWSFISRGSDNYYSYSKENKHPFTTEGVISVNAYAVTDSSAEKDGDGEKISFKYDAAAFEGSFEGMGKIKSFESTVWINSEGYCYRLDQKGVFEKDGEENVYDYSMFIDMMNAVDRVERVEHDDS